ncbi:asparagine synthase [Dictyocaulus viviparus]|uniref:Asparagine synthetase [glutamine-hydrolyzing] n=1 Tax=Dictyocaulus viviparus TaxID=29172 RepID=A0A0D8XXP5_DICVI|nr:asparagine synthase [Dictyocaulus viviparus]
MCGIFAICHNGCKLRFDIVQARELSKRQAHRGPDFSGSYCDDITGDILCHERLAVVDLNITQPIMGTNARHQVIHNGAIYNHQNLRNNELKGMSFRTRCDSEVIIFLYEKLRDGSMCNLLDGVFAFALCFDGEFLAARDPIGVKQMYYGIDKYGRYFFSNEMKTFDDICGSNVLAIFPPGHFFQPDKGFVRYYQPLWIDSRLATREEDLKSIHDTLIEAVKKRLMSDAPLGILLSGGLDSSLVSSIAAREMAKSGLVIHSFSIGVDHDSPDVIAARKVAKHIGTHHHEFYFSVQEGLDNLRNLIWHLETYDITSIRASTPMYFLSAKIREMGIKVVLSGEGADEIFGGYLYFHNAPNDEEFQKETVDRVLHLYTADCLRADKSTMAHSVEVRVPFLDKDFLELAILTAPQYKRPRLVNGRYIEKYTLRKAFDKDTYLPHEILWRQKEQFSDGVGYSWIDQLMTFCAEQVSDEEFSKADELFPFNTPHSKEAFYMRKLFHLMFPSENAAKTVRKWIPKWQSDQDPSGRASHMHEYTVRKNEKTTETWDAVRHIEQRPYHA